MKILLHSLEYKLMIEMNKRVMMIELHIRVFSQIYTDKNKMFLFLDCTLVNDRE